MPLRRWTLCCWIQSPTWVRGRAQRSSFASSSSELRGLCGNWLCGLLSDLLSPKLLGHMGPIWSPDDRGPISASLTHDRQSCHRCHLPSPLLPTIRGPGAPLIVMVSNSRSCDRPAFGSQDLIFRCSLQCLLKGHGNRTFPSCQGLPESPGYDKPEYDMWRQEIGE